MKRWTFPGGYSPFETRGDCVWNQHAAEDSVEFFPRFLKHLKPESLSVFNIDFFGVLGGGDDSWWHTERPEAVVTQRHHPHNGPKEFAYFRRLGFTKKEDGWWTWTHSTGE